LQTIRGEIEITLGDGVGFARLAFEAELGAENESIGGLLLPIVELLVPEEDDEYEPDPGEEVVELAPAEASAIERFLAEKAPPSPVIARPRKIAAKGAHVCETCSASYPTSQGLAGHRRSHQTIECDNCGKTVGAAGIGPHRKACRARPQASAADPHDGSPAVAEPVDIETRRRRAAAAAVYDS
jgi:hypothetical protein